MGLHSPLNPKQKRVKAWIEALGFTKNHTKIIHIVGTNGKGSTGAYISSILQTANDQVGHFSSPHVLSYNERIRINGKAISEQDLIDIQNILTDVKKRKKLPYLLYFEKSFVEALFAFQNFDWIVLEAGVGGKDDVTHILDTDYQIITPIGLDHMNSLGGSLEEVAQHKADIIENRGLVFSSKQEAEVEKILRKIAQERKARIYFLDDSMYSLDKTKQRKSSSPSMDFIWKKGSLQGSYHLSMMGYHQVDNAALAILFAQEGLSYKNKEDIEEALDLAYMPGRLQLLAKDPAIWVDGAHNDQAVKQLMDNFDLLDLKNPILIFGMHKEKISQAVREELFSKMDELYFVDVENQSDEAIKNQVQNHLLNLIDKDRKNPILICGSLYILSPAIAFIKESKKVSTELSHKA